MTTVALPDCPGCRQSYTSVYNKQLGCTRCRTLNTKPRPTEQMVEPAAPTIQPFNTTAAVWAGNS